MSGPYPPTGKGVPSDLGWGAPPGSVPQPGYPGVPPSSVPQPGNPGVPPQPGYPGPPPGNVHPGYPGNPGSYPPPYSAQPTGYPAPQPVPGYPVQPPYGHNPHAEPYNYNQPPANVGGGGSVYQSGTPNINPNMTTNNPKPEDTMEGFANSFSEKAIRMAFIRKVYIILMVQLLVTLGVVSLFTFHDGVKSFVRHNFWVYLISYFVFLVTYISLVCCSGLRRKWPSNIIMLSLFTLALSYMTGTIASYHDTKLVVMTIGITAGICFLLTLFATQTKYDFTGWGIYLFVGSCVVMIFMFVAIFTYNKIMHTIYSGAMALLFSCYLVYDTQMIIGGRKYEISPEEYIYGALQLYLDVVQIFIALLGLSRN